MPQTNVAAAEANEKALCYAQERFDGPRAAVAGAVSKTLGLRPLQDLSIITRDDSGDAAALQVFF